MPDKLTLTYPSGLSTQIPAQPSQHELQEAAQRLHTRTDALALEATIAAHLALPTTSHTTILYGSRARGFYHNSESKPSNVNLLIIPDDRSEPKHPWHIHSAAEHAASAKMREFGQEADVDVIQHTGQQMEFLLQFRNTTPTEAVIHGIAVSDQPLRWTSPYLADNPPRPRYHWALYDRHLFESKVSADFSATLVDDFIAIQFTENPDTPDDTAPNKEQNRRDFISLQVHSNARYGIYAAFRAAIAAHGALPGRKMTIVELSQHLESIEPDQAPILQMTPQQHADSFPQLGEDITKYATLALADIKTVRDLAKRTRRRTAATHPGSTSQRMTAA